MATKLVLEALETLHKELDKMQPAVRQVEIAEQVIAEARKIPEHYLALMNRLEGQESQFKQKLVGELTGHIDEVKKGVGDVLKKADTTIIDLTEHEDQFKQLVMDELKNHAVQVKKEVDTLVIAARSTISNLTEREKQFDELRKNLEPLVSQLSGLEIEPRLDKLQATTDKELEHLASSSKLLETSIKEIEDRLNKTEVAIGNRLTEEGKTRRDQLESNANTIILEIGKLSDKFKAIETLLGDRIGDLDKKLEESTKNLNQEIISHTEKVQTSIGELLSRFDEIEKQQKSQKTLTFITWALIAIAASVTVFLK